MPLFDNVKRQAARAAFEADRLLRLNRADAGAEQLRAELAEAVRQLGVAAYELHHRGALMEPALVELGDVAREAEGRLREKEREIAAIKREASAPAGLPTAVYGHLCPSCRVRLPLDAVFCPTCGGHAVDVPRPASKPALTPEAAPPAGSGDWSARSAASASYGWALPETVAAPASAFPASAPRVAPPEPGDGLSVLPAALEARISAPASEPPRAQTELAPTVMALRPTEQNESEPPVPVVEKRCSRCKAVLSADALFCTECGARLPPQG